MAVGSERGTTNLDVLAVDQLFCAGTMVGSVMNVGTEADSLRVTTTLDVVGTITGSVANVTTAGVKGALTGSVISGSGLNCNGTITGSVANLTTVGVKGTVTGSFIKGTVDGAYTATSIPASALKVFSCKGTGVSTSNGSYAHGLGAAPSFVSVVPLTSFISNTGSDIGLVYQPAAADATNIVLVAGTMGTVDIFALG